MRDADRLRATAKTLLDEAVLRALIQYCGKLAEHAKMAAADRVPVEVWFTDRVMSEIRAALAACEHRDPQLAAILQEHIDRFFKEAPRVVRSWAAPARRRSLTVRPAPSEGRNSTAAAPRPANGGGGTGTKRTAAGDFA